MVEVNSETDFVARNDLFQGLVRMIAQVALDVGADVETIKAAKVGDATVADALSSAIATIGENMTLRRAAELSVAQGVVASYMHNSVTEGLGKIGVLVALKSTGKDDELMALGRLVAMQVAASNPQAIDASGLDPAVIAREREVIADKARAQGKAEKVIDKIVESGLKTYLQGGLSARSALHPRPEQERRPGLEGSGEEGRRRDRGDRLRALRARRRHRPQGRGFRGRGRCGRRAGLSSTVRLTVMSLGDASRQITSLRVRGEVRLRDARNPGAGDL